MAQIVLEIPNDQAARVVDALCKAGGYSGPANDSQARQRFAKQQIADHIREVVRQVEVNEAMSAAMSQAQQVTPVDVT